MLLATLDATPLLGPRTGIGRYTAELVAALPAAAARRDVDLRLQVMTWTARGNRVQGLPAGVRQVGRRTPARLLQAAWSRWDAPRVELLGASGDVFHGTNFVVPPSRQAGVVTVHDLTFLDRSTAAPQNLVYQRLVPRALERGALVVTPTAAVADAVAEHYGVPRDRVAVTPLGVDPAWSAVRPPTAEDRRRLGLPDDYLVFVGSLEPRKNVPTLLDAVARLREHGRETALVLAGPAGSRPLPPEVEELAGAPWVHRTGWLEEDDLRAVVAGSRGLVLPSADEGFGLPVLEALATGRPIAVSTAPALLEVAGPHAVTAGPGDPEGLADALDRVLDLPDDDAARQARRDWAGRWTWDACADATLDVYLRVAR
jgi:glycosyltransferase involved in cell wall biosynthesis